MKPLLSLDDLYRMRRLREGKLLPQSLELVFVVSQASDDVDRFEIRRLDPVSGRQTVLARDLPACAGLRPSPDGRHLTFMGLVDGVGQIMVMDTLGRMEPTPLRVMPRGIASAPLWSPDGRWLAFTAIGDERVAKGPYEPVRSASVHYKFDGGVGLTQRRAQDIFIVSADGAEVRRLTHGPGMCSQPYWAPDSRSLAFMATLEPHGIEFTTAVGVVSLDGELSWPIEAVEDYIFCAPAFAGTGDRVMLACKPLGRVLGAQARLYTASLTAGSGLESRTERLCTVQRGHVTRGALLPMGVGSLFARQPISPVGSDHAFCMVELQGQTVIHRVALSGAERCVPLTPPDRSAYLLDADAHHLLWASTTMSSPPDLWLSDADGGNPKQLTALNDEFLTQRTLPEVLELQVQNEGHTVHTWILRPSGATTPLPTVLEIHGGPHCSWGNAFNLWAQALAGAGFAVILPNPRGSSGYGDAFGTAIHGCWGEPDGRDLMATVDEAISRGIADPARLGIGGVSGGGHLTTWLLGQTDRFKAAVPEQMLTNMVSFYGESDIGRLLIKGEYGVTPQTDHELLWRFSPLAYAHRVRTPTLLIQCELDVRCPMGEAEQYFRALRDAGCVAEFMRIPGSFHAGPQYGGITALARVRDEPALDWYRRYLT